VHALGTSDELDVRAQAYGKKPDKVDVHAVVAPGSEQLVRSPVIRVNDSAGDLVIRAAGVEQSGERLKIDRLTIEGPGRATASLSYGRELERLKLDAKELDVARVLRIIGVRTRVKSSQRLETVFLGWPEAENLRALGIQGRKSGGGETRRRAPEPIAVSDPCAASDFRVLVANEDGGAVERRGVVGARGVRFMVVNPCGGQ